ncbi:Fungal specific transcription factor domain [Ceratobasidium sp. AG-Ba]|nr:Fungal specific transcription factor domain [Ceratobasidium sp. AG-Ba]
MTSTKHSRSDSADELGREHDSPKIRGRACTECRSIKVKCENQHPSLDGPCTRCTRLSLDCIYREKKRGRKPRHAHPYAGDGPSEILLQQNTPSTSSSYAQMPSPNVSTSQASSYVNSAERYGEARFDHEYSPARGPPVSPYTMSSHTDFHNRESPHFHLQRVEPALTYPILDMGANAASSSTSGSGTGTSAGLDPDRSLKLLGGIKEPHPPNTSTNAYSLANILTDSRPASPVSGAPGQSSTHEPNSTDNYDDPVTAGIIPPDAVRVLFNFYHESLNPIIALLDPALHSPSYVRSRSSVLFTAILCVACRFVRPRAWDKCNALGQTLLGRALADGVCSIEYVQALSLLTFWKDPTDSSSWRKVGLAIRMAYELNLHERREKPLPAIEQLAREQLNRERTWLQLVCYDLTTAMQRSKPQMIPDFRLQDAYDWLSDHPQFPCNADMMLVASAALGGVRILCHSLFSSMNVSNKSAFEPLMRHVAHLMDERVQRWVVDNDGANLAPVSKALLKFASLNLKLIVSELRLLGLIQPQLSSARTHSLECIKCAMDILHHVITEMTPHRYITYCQDQIAITTAYAGVWLFKQLPYVDGELYQEIVDTLKRVSTSCGTLAQHQGDTPSYFVQFFDHLVRNAGTQRVSGATSVTASNMGARPEMVDNSNFMSISQPMDVMQVPELIPPIEGMDRQWISVMNGLNDWWKNFNYLGTGVGWNVNPNPNLGP